MRHNILVIHNNTFAAEGLKAQLHKLTKGKVDLLQYVNVRNAIGEVNTSQIDLVMIEVYFLENFHYESWDELIRISRRIKLTFFNIPCNNYLRQRMKELPIHGYFLKNTDADHYQQGITVIMSGGFYEGKLKADQSYGSPTEEQCCENINSLSAPEMEILQLLVEGRTLDEIEYALDIPQKTVETYKNVIKMKMEAKNMAELIRYGTEFGVHFIKVIDQLVKA